MKNAFKKLFVLGALALTVTAGGYRARVSAPTAKHAAVPAYHHTVMVADGDIGDGTSPTRKG